MAKVSKVQKIGILSREKQIDDYNKYNQYSENHKDAISDGDVMGKGTKNNPVNDIHHVKRTKNYSKEGGVESSISYQINTAEGGGKYDIEGRNDIGGRERAQNINFFSPGARDYSVSSNNLRLKTDNVDLADGGFSGEYREDQNFVPHAPKDVVMPSQHIRPQLMTKGYGDAIDQSKRQDLISMNLYNEEDDNNYYRMVASGKIGEDFEGQVGY